jgi:hypothetical protein
MVSDRDGLRFWITSIKVLNFDHQRVLSPLNHLFHPALLVATAASNIWAIRYLCSTMPTMQHERFLWIHDFSARSIDVDPSLKLPLICAAVQFASLAVAAWPQFRPPAIDAPPPSSTPAPTPAAPPANRAQRRKAGASAPVAAAAAAAAPAAPAVATPPRAGRITKAIVGVSFAFNLLFTIVSPFFPQGVLLMHWLPSSLFGLTHMLGMRYLSTLPSFRKWVTSRPSIAYAQAAAAHWHNNPLRPLDYDQLKQRLMFKKVKQY